MRINNFTGKSGSNKVEKDKWEFLLALTKQELARAPISYYTKSPRPVKVTLNVETKDTSYYMPDKNAISISFFNIFKCFAEKDLDYIKNNTEWVRKLIRGQQYHELSHAILTPSDLMIRGGKRRHNDVFNVVEDERIETIHKSYYKGVDFKKSIMEICEWKGQEADNAWTYFFQTVRFRHGEQQHLDAVSDFIVKWFSLSGDAFQVRDSWSNQVSYGYISDVNTMRADMLDLYRTIIKDWFEKNTPDELNAEAEKFFGQQIYTEEQLKDAAESLIDSGNNDDIDDNNIIVIEGPITITCGPDSDGPGPEGGDGPTIIFKGKVTLEGEKGGEKENSNSKSRFEGGIEDNRTGEDKKNDQDGEGQNGEGQNDNKGTDRREGKSSQAGQGGDPSNSEGAQAGEGTGEEGEGERSGSGKSQTELAKEAADKAAEDEAKAVAAGKGGNGNTLEALANKDYDPEVFRGLETLFIKRVRKDRKTQGRNIGWTGRIDPRLLGKGNRSQTKQIFVKENKDQNNKFKGKEFINLIMVQDTSGSYDDSEKATNTIFEALDRIEYLHSKMFKWNLITVSNGIDIRDKDDHKIHASGGTHLTPEIYGAIKGFESNKGLNIYVTLFDGSCYGGEHFAAMNKKNSIIIDNRTDNQENIDAYAPKAVRISVTDGRFAEKLYSILYKELDKILR